MKKVSLLVGAVLMLGFTTLSFAEMKTVVLDVNKVFASLPQIKDMQTNIKAKFDPRGKALVDFQNTFKGDLTKYQKAKPNLKGEALTKEQKKLIEENKQLRGMRDGLQRDLIAAQNEALRPVLENLQKVVADISVKGKIDLVITKTSTAYNNPKYEITDQVIAQMKKLKK